ncbi:MAG TPA: hypothetical protein VE988_17735 [Gemmataceae bacterium]|nr:hypothetical protein [Gemmataceae bacterium]
MSQHVAQADEVLNTQVALPAFASSCSLPPVVLLEYGIRQVNSPPPPTDLVISLQHLVI